MLFLNLNFNENAIELLKKNLDKIYWSLLSYNSNVLSLLEANQDKINWYNLTFNTNPKAIDLLKKNENKLNDIHWFILLKNKNAIEIIEKFKNNHKINWILISKNPAIFIYDYDKIREIKNNLHEKLLEVSLNPDRLFKLMNDYNRTEVIKVYFN